MNHQSLRTDILNAKCIEISTEPLAVALNHQLVILTGEGATLWIEGN